MYATDMVTVVLFTHDTWWCNKSESHSRML